MDIFSGAVVVWLLQKLERFVRWSYKKIRKHSDKSINAPADSEVVFTEKHVAKLVRALQQDHGQEMTKAQRKARNMGKVMGMLEVACAMEDAIEESSKPKSIKLLMSGESTPADFMSFEARIKEKLSDAYDEMERGIKGEEVKLKHWEKTRASLPKPKPTDDSEKD